MKPYNKFFLYFLTITFLSLPHNLFAQTNTPTITFTPVPCSGQWVQKTASAAFPNRERASAVTMVDPADGLLKMWIIGGHGPVSPGGFKDVWASVDGVNWVQKTNTAPWFARFAHTSVVMPDPLNGGQMTMWVIGGRGTQGNLSASGLDDVWKSTNGINWVQATASAGLGFPSGHTSVVMVDPADGLLKMWVIGGEYAGSLLTNSGKVFASVNGVNWVQKTPNGAFGSRFEHTSVVFNGRMWVIAGATNNSVLTNDVWSSLDGVNWTLATPGAAFNIRNGHTSVVCGGKMWVIGGGVGPQNDVWVSADGANELCDQHKYKYCD